MHFKISSDKIKISDEFSNLFSHKIKYVFLVELNCPESEKATKNCSEIKRCF